jgi:uncharacterized protein YjbI with pentapeptide repeats
MTRDDALRELAQGKNLGGRRLVDLDLTGAAFSSANLAATVFERCRLAGATFAGANLVGARFVRAAGLTPATIAALERAGAVVERPPFRLAPLAGWLAILAAALAALFWR